MLHAIQSWRDNAHMIADIAASGLYLRPEWATIDCTYGLGNFWKQWKPDYLLGCDLDPKKSPVGFSVDFTDLINTFGHSIWDVSVFDPPYMLNGTSTNRGPAAKNASYGVNTPYIPVKDKMALMAAGLEQCLLVTKPGGYVLVKCMDQVVSGSVVWQTLLLTDHAVMMGGKLEDMFHIVNPTPSAQPPGRTQRHARRNYSTLLVIRRVK